MSNRTKAKNYLLIAIIAGVICGITWLIWGYNIIVTQELFKNRTATFIVFITFGVSGIISKLTFNQYRKLHAGIVGEDKTQDILQSLPNTYKILSNVSIEHDGKKGEIDSLIISPRGLCIVETKNYRGKLYGHEEDREWTHSKVSTGMKTYENTVKNPIKQANRQAYILSGMLRSQLHINCWIDTYVLLLEAECLVDSSKVFTDSKKLLKEIQQSGKENTLNSNQIQSIINMLEE